MATLGCTLHPSDEHACRWLAGSRCHRCVRLSGGGGRDCAARRAMGMRERDAIEQYGYMRDRPDEPRSTAQCNSQLHLQLPPPPPSCCAEASDALLDGCRSALRDFRSCVRIWRWHLRSSPHLSLFACIAATSRADCAWLSSNRSTSRCGSAGLGPRASAAVGRFFLFILLLFLTPLFIRIAAPLDALESSRWQLARGDC